MIGFEYPVSPHVRRHGPTGYKDHNSFRDWLRDEFTFRCVYCLHREQWYGRGATFHVEHFIPSTPDPNLKSEYTNLLYACATCHEAKRAIIGLSNPCNVAFNDSLRVTANGVIQALNPDGQRLEQVLRLNSETNVRHRSRWMRVLEALRWADPLLYQEYMGFPKDLSDLRIKRVPTNTKPAGAVNCYFALRERGELPATY
jgi:hypothetical protein